MSDLVSVIITTYMRDPQMVFRAVNSVLKQTYDNIELIIVDDSPETYEKRILVQEMVCSQSDRIKYIQHKTNLGACAARNTGLSVANGSYVAFLDDDDEWKPEKIEKQIALFSDSDVALVYCNKITIDDNSLNFIEEPFTAYRGLLFDKLILHNFIGSTSIPLIRKKCIDEVGGFDPEMKSAQDYDLWLRLAKRYKIDFVNAPLVRYHIHSGERITTRIQNRILGQERLIEKNRVYLEKNNRAYWVRNIRLATQYALAGRLIKAITIWYQSVRRNPLQVIDNLKYLIKIVVYHNRSHKKD